MEIDGNGNEPTINFLDDLPTIFLERQANMRTVIPAEKKQNNPPSIFWHSPSKQFISRIGYADVDPQGTPKPRFRTTQYLGKHEASARAMATEIDHLWEANVDEWKRQNARQQLYYRIAAEEWIEKKAMAYQGDEIPPQPVKPLPVWLPDFAQRLSDYVQKRPTPNPSPKSVTIPQPQEPKKLQLGPINIKDAKEQFLASLQDRIGLAAGRGLKQNTYTVAAIQLEYVLSRHNLIPLSHPLSSLDKTVIENIVNYWLSLPKTNNKKISPRTAVNYLRMLKKFIEWADSTIPDYQKPKGIDALFSFSNFNKVDIRPYTPAELKQLLDNAIVRTKAFILLGINCGFYQVDISTLKKSHIVTIDGETFIQRVREKTSHQDGLQGQWWLFPETASLLKQFAEENPDSDYVFIGKTGKPIMSFNSNGTKIDNISTAWFRLVHDVDNLKNKRFKDLRKTLATEIGRIASSDVARVALAQKTGGELKRYMAEDFKKVTAALKTWHTELTAAGVFDSLKEKEEQKPDKPNK